MQLQVLENDKVEIKKVYMGLVLLYEDLREVIPIIQTSTGLEYDITTKIKTQGTRCANRASLALKNTKNFKYSPMENHKIRLCAL